MNAYLESFFKTNQQKKKTNAKKSRTFANPPFVLGFIVTTFSAFGSNRRQKMF